MLFLLPTHSLVRVPTKQPHSLGLCSIETALIATLHVLVSNPSHSQTHSRSFDKIWQLNIHNHMDPFHFVVREDTNPRIRVEYIIFPRSISKTNPIF